MSKSAQSILLTLRKALYLGAAVSFMLSTSVSAQSLPGEIESPQLPQISEAEDSLPNSEDNFDFDEEEFEFQKTPEELKAEARKEAFDAALQGLLPLQPEEIRKLLERYDRTQESVAVPVYPAPKPEVVVEDISLDPGSPPAVIKMAYGHVTTLTFLDSTGSPWPVENISWAGDFEVVDTETDEDRFQHIIRLSPQSEFARGNMSVSLLALQTPVIITLDTNRDVVHYRFDAVIPDYGPLATAPIIEAGISTRAGNKDMSSALEGVFPAGAVRLAVIGVDGRTSAYRHGQKTYVRTPLSLLSPGWSSSVSSADGTKVYEIDNTPVLLLSDKGKMVRAKLSDREDFLNEQ